MFTTTKSAVIGAFYFLRPRGICPAKDVECEKISCFLPHGKKRVKPRYCDEKRERTAPSRQERTCRTRLIAMTALTMLFGNSAENSDNPASSLPHGKKRVKPRYCAEKRERAAPSRQERTALYVTICEDGYDKVIRGIARRTATTPRSSITHRKKRVKPRYSDEEQGRAARTDRSVLVVRDCLRGRP